MTGKLRLGSESSITQLWCGGTQQARLGPPEGRECLDVLSRSAFRSVMAMQVMNPETEDAIKLSGRLHDDAKGTAGVTVALLPIGFLSR